MKRGTIEHRKMGRLCRRLGIPKWQAVGLLESLWHYTAREADDGGIGRIEDQDIAYAIDYQGDETDLIRALVDTGWLDEHPVHRLIVHDWSQHADQYIHLRLRRYGRKFADGAEPYSRIQTFKPPQKGKPELAPESRDNVTEPRDNVAEPRDTVAQNSDSARQCRAKTEKSATMSQKNAPYARAWPEPEPVPVPEPVPEERSSLNSREHRAREAPVSTIPKKPKPHTTNATPPIPPVKRLGPPPRRANSPPPALDSPEDVTKLIEARNALIRFARACPGPAAAWDPPDWELVTGVLSRCAGDLEAMLLMLKELEARKSQPGSSWGWFLTCAEKWAQQEVS